MSNIVIAALYKFIQIKDVHILRKKLLRLCQLNSIKGSLLIASEGINGTIAGSRAAIDVLKTYFHEDIRFHNLDEYKESFAVSMPFYRLKVRLKKEIVTLGVSSVDVFKKSGNYIDPKNWNALISDPEVTVIDVRNHYEVEIGTFPGSINPKTKTFRDFPSFIAKNLNPKNHKKIAIQCTGGIRCVKASAYLMDQGFENVYQLKGGILKYLETVPEPESLWKGQCFVFDQRTAIGQDLTLSEYINCYACRHPVSKDDQASIYYKQGLSCPKCYDNLSLKTKKRTTERQLQCQLAAQRGTRHVGS